MISKRLVFSIFIIFIIIQEADAQANFKYGLNLGLTHSNQLWESNGSSHTLSREKDYKSGFTVSLVSEFEMNNFLSFRFGLGYLQKGFKETNFVYTSQASHQINNDNKNLTLHNLVLDFNIKLGNLKSKFSPYVLIGLRSDFLLSYEDVVVNDPVYIYEVMYSYSHVLDNYNQPCIGAIIGAGIEFMDSYYLEFEYNPSILPSYDSNDYEVKDRCFSVKLGVNINKLFAKDTDKK